MITTTTTPTRSSRSPLRRPRLFGFLAAAVIIAAGSYGLALVRPPAGTDTPRQASPTGAPELGIPGSAAALPRVGSLAQIDRSIAAWTKNLAANPGDYLSATNLGALYQGRGRLTADLADQGRALMAVTTALEIEPSHAPARALDASVRFTLHDFEGALASASSLVADDPSQLGALATRADAELELGQLEAATADYQRLAAATSGPAVDVRLARLAYVTGDPAEAVARARAARDAAGSDSGDAGFYEYALAEYARLTGDAMTARAGYEAALRLRPTDTAALLGLARIDAFEGDAAAAIAGLRRAAEIAPQPETLALLGDLLVGQGQAAEADGHYDTVRFAAELDSTTRAAYDRQIIAFELDHQGATDAILSAARASLAAQPDAAGHDLVAWALHRLGRDEEAAASSQAARAGGIVDARILFHAGAIALSQGSRDEGRAFVEQALALGPALDPAARAEAEALLGR